MTNVTSASYYALLVISVTCRLYFSERHGGTQYFVEQSEEELSNLNLPVYALYDFGNCSKSLSLSRAELLETCGFTVASGRCRPQYFMSVLCARPPLTTTSRPTSIASKPSASTAQSAASTSPVTAESLATTSSVATPSPLPSSSPAASMASSLSTVPSVTTELLESLFLIDMQCLKRRVEVG